MREFPQEHCVQAPPRKASDNHHPPLSPIVEHLAPKQQCLSGPPSPSLRAESLRVMPVDSELARGVLLEVFRWIPCGIGVLDAHGELVLSNNVLESWLSPGMGGRAESLFEDPEVLRRLVTRAQRAGSAREGETMVVDAQGRRFTVSVTLSPMDFPGDHAARFLLILEDISDKKLSSQELLRTGQLASLGTMAGGVAHDFNNILMTILGNTQLLHKELYEADPQIRRRLKNIEQAVLDGAHVVRRLQVFTGKDRGVSKGEDRTLIHEAVHDVLELTRPRWKNVLEKQGTSVEIVKDLTPNLCAAINPADFREVLTNLVFNAVDAMPRGGVLRFRSYPERDQVCLEVSDTGVGMDEATQKKIFDAFFTTKGVGNSGLGLSVCASLIRRWAGHLGVRSVPGQGTTFTLKLPAARTKACQPVTPKASPARATKKHLLVVDDDREVLELLGDMLRLMGHTVTALHDPSAALDILAAQSFDLVLTDLGMPKVSGWEVAACARKHQPGVPVILVSGWGGQYEDEDLRDRGVDGVCSKPLSYQKLLEMMDRFAP